MPIPHIGNHSLPHYVLRLRNNYCSLFHDTLTPPICGLHQDCAILKVGKLANLPPPQWNKAELKVPEDRVGIHWRTDSGDVSVLLCSLADVDKILSKDLPHLVMRGYFYSIYLYCILFHLILLPPILTDNEALSLHDHSNVDT